MGRFSRKVSINITNYPTNVNTALIKCLLTFYLLKVSVNR